MNLNPLILANIQSSVYFKVGLFKLKTYHEVIDEIYYQVKHLEPWERGSRKSAGTGMCGGVRGVGAGGIVSSAFCLLYKLYTLKLTRKQVNGLITHSDSPYIRGLGFMYIRFTQPPADLFDWYEEFLEDDEEVDVKAGNGQTMTIGLMCRQFLTKLDWFSTLFPRIPVPIQKSIEQKLGDYDREHPNAFNQHHQQQQQHQQQAPQQQRYGNSSNDRRDNNWDRQPRDDRKRSPARQRSKERNYRDYDREDRDSKHSQRKRSTSRDRYGGSSNSSKSKYYDRDRSRSRSKSRDRKERSKKHDYEDDRSSSRKRH
ncbi:unnamed protein product [Diamesa hyperborea]